MVGEIFLRYYIKLVLYLLDRKGVIVAQHKDGRFTVVPRHDHVDRGTLSGILEDVELSKEEFVALLKKKK